MPDRHVESGRPVAGSVFLDVSGGPPACRRGLASGPPVGLPMVGMSPPHLQHLPAQPCFGVLCESPAWRWGFGFPRKGLLGGSFKFLPIWGSD